MKGERAPGEAAPQPVASYRHSAIFLGIVAAVMAAGFSAQQRHTAGGGLVDSHDPVIPLYVSVTAMNWLLVFFVWRGIRRRGGTFASLIQGRWGNAREVLRDLGLSALFWGLLLAVAWGLDRLPVPEDAKSLDLLLPRSALEVGIWVLTCASAGFCEEFVFRGYAQRQLLAWSGSTVVSVLGQAVIFGLMHAYQGWVATARIVVIGVLFGALAAWRKTLRVGMVAHAWYDFWAGWLSRVLLRT
jgi:membrane protease YdiL (CAAX protease family)